MVTKAKGLERKERLYRDAQNADISELKALTSQKTQLSDYPYASAVEKNILIYDCKSLMSGLEENRQLIMAEWADAMANGPGVVVLKGAEPDHALIDRVSDLFAQMIDHQNSTGTGGGDHFAKPGANDRIWNSLEKHCLADPESFVGYYSNEFLAMISEAWLGPHYQMTAQLNVVNPGGAAQSPHRDYHLGFQSAADIERYPMHVQQFSSMLTLQGAIAHVDASLESGPTQLLPYSQLWRDGYLAMGRSDVKEHFAESFVQLPLKKGDMLFFSPALLHAAGSNRTADLKRMVNLFQVSSAYGRAMESVDRGRMCKAIYPVLRRFRHEGSITDRQLLNALASTAEGYSFPTNLDRDPPLGGLAPKTQSQLMHESLVNDWDEPQIIAALEEQTNKRNS